MGVHGKAAGLRRMAETGAVPPFIVLAGEWIERQGEALETAVLAAVDDAGLRPPFAVRSSAPDEDGVATAFAGMYETLLGVQRSRLGEAVATVAASGRAERVQAYREALGLADGAATIDVVVQEIVEASVAGVAFSRDPVEPGCVRVEAVKGLGEELVDGRAIPERHVLERETLAERTYKAGRQYAETRADGSRARMSGRAVRARRLAAEQARAIAEQTLALEALFPDAVNGVDVEWALADGELRLLQCRPITTAVEHREGAAR